MRLAPFHSFIRVQSERSHANRERENAERKPKPPHAIDLRSAAYYERRESAFRGWIDGLAAENDLTGMFELLLNQSESLSIGLSGISGTGSLAGRICCS